MAGYSTSAPPINISGPLTGAGRLWVYTTVDAAATVDAAGYITNGFALGMQVNDLVIVIDTATPLITMHVVQSVATNGAANLGLGTTIGSASTGD